MTTQQVTFADFVVQTRKWQKWAEQKISDIENRISQLESAFGTVEETLNETQDEVTHKLAEMSAMLESTNGMISELLDNMPELEEEEDETRNATMDKIEGGDDAGLDLLFEPQTPKLEFQED